MKAPQRDEFDRLFKEAAALPLDERSRYLASNCQDPTIRRKLESLLACIVTHTHGFPTAIGGVAQSLAMAQLVGQRVGTYSLIGKIGQGGMGTVYRAVRADDEFQKTVAIKMLRVHDDDATLLRRFRHERQVLATLEHPNIARLLDGGSWLPPGASVEQPYIVIEYVEGKPLTAYCDDQKLGIPQRLRLFQQVCSAVSYAHRHLIVHRDIKPDNILVAADGTPKLLDFGISKLLDGGEGPSAVTQTATGIRAMTPDYASPEQVLGKAVSTVTDVYSLGTVLYELLTGNKPHRFASYDALEIARSICEREVAPPSSVGGSALRGDLDVIVLKAMQKEPGRRYGSVGEFSEDIRRYLEGLPITARADTLSYRTAKYVQRHKIGLAAAAAVFLALAGGVVVSQRQARIAQARFQQVRKLANRFLFDFDDKIRRLPGSTAAREMVVATALEYLDNLSRDAHGDPGLQWELSKAYEKVGDVQGSPVDASLGRTEAALASYKTSIAMQEDLASRGFLNAAQQESLAHSYAQISAVYRLKSSGQAAVEAAERGVAHARLVSDLAMAHSKSHLGLALLVAGDPARALETVEPVLPAIVADAERENKWGPAHNGVANFYSLLGQCAYRMARLEESVAYYEKAIGVREPRLSAAIFDPENARELVLDYQWVGNILGAPDRFNLGRPHDAESQYRKALALAERLSASDPDNATGRAEVARSCGKLGTVIAALKPAEALTLYRRASEITERLIPDGPIRISFRAAALLNESIPLAHLGRLDEAQKSFRQAIDIYESESTKRPKDFSALNDLSDAWVNWGDVERDPQAAAACYRKALDYADRAADIAPKDFAVAFHQVRAMEALGLRRRLVELWTKWDGLQPGSPFIQERLAKARSAS
jgi:serine/threonine protein kinase